MFHIFSKETNISADTNGNVATKTYHSGNEFGTRKKSHNLTATKDVNYIEKIEDIGANAFRAQDQTVVVGKDSDNVQKQGNQVFVNGKRLDHLHAKDLRKEDEIHLGHKYIDIDREFKKLELNSNSFARNKQSEGMQVNFNDMNNRYIDVSNAKKDEFNNIYVDLDAQYLMAPQPITIKGISEEKEAPTIIVNIRNSNAELTAGTQTRLIYHDNGTLSPSESHPRRNKVLWNFGKELKKLDVSSGYMMGSILAPNAVVTLNVNVDGNIVAEVVNVKGGESHRWDLQPSKPKVPKLPDNEFIVPPPLPEDPNKDKPGSDNPGKDEEKPKSEDPIRIKKNLSRKFQIRARKLQSRRIQVKKSQLLLLGMRNNQRWKLLKLKIQFLQIQVINHLFQMNQ
ncbi:collagen-binding domain-containing protein [Lactobacillus helveticus]|uniref:Choice-of-anchor A domain-containing protein n=1 Tax=Lactobacillus helveticus TaxID=1587 RepID=A0A9Q5C0L9_LACHE|nr:collagen-binding domain-containing protein [Lactobacillus helveticus]NRN78432.1 hypothetical protein [Lactobacillus helveticus]NRN80369.1 hypothetical protein [Lactobacillus helveticus]NRN82776.1 hypothetical protein [Lactobacillus helveticus]NRN84685.1 hypothetical protein [Lactobacillus helveticus]NRN86943.1 hypothetical protein [Lactobacillus helveticus]